MGLRDCFLIITFVGSSLAGWVHGAALREECRSVSSFSDVVKHVFSGYIRLNGSRDNRMSNCYVCVTGQDGSEMVRQLQDLDSIRGNGMILTLFSSRITGAGSGFASSHQRFGLWN